MWFELLVLLALVLGNGLLAGAEMAIVALRKSRLEQLVDEKGRPAAALAELRRTPERFLATVQIGITVIGAAAGAYGGGTISKDLVPVLAPLVGGYADALAFGIVVAGISYLSLVLGELVPKSLALRATERYALFASRPLLRMSKLARPLVWLLTQSSNAVLRLFGDRTSFIESRISPEEVKSMLDEATEGGSIDSRASTIASRAIELSELTAEHVMVPRQRIVSLPKSATHEQLRNTVSSAGYSRVLIYDETPDNLVGYVSVRDAYAGAAQDPRGLIEPLVRPLVFIPETMHAVDVLEELRARRQHLAVVVDEHGSTAGLVTRVDLVEELVGEMLSENVAARQAPTLDAEGTAVVAGDTSVRDLNRSLGVDLPEDEGWTTIAGMCLGLFGRIPESGERIDAGNGIMLEVVDASPRGVRAVRLRVPEALREPGRAA
jgi:putative hemolysin